VSLSAAAKGYAYQDLTTAIVFTDLLIRPELRVTVDRKASANDKFDDLAIWSPDGSSNRQIKWSAPEKRSLSADDFTDTQSKVRFDLLVASYRQNDVIRPAQEYRLAVAWGTPTDGSLNGLVVETADPPSVAGSNSRCFRLVADNIWPENGEPLWACLKEIQRSDFAAFAERFVLETNTPPFSGSLRDPGPLEQLLLQRLTETVGIGLYPNQDRSADNVAGHLIHLATSARANGATLTWQDISREIGLRVDYGHVAQQFPADDKRAIHRPSLRALLDDAIARSTTVLLTGPPGSGKSWALHAYANELRSKGALVARHYCYLEPGDPDVERRITVNALLGNLIHELVEIDPSLRTEKHAAYAATADELLLLLAAAVERHPFGVVLAIDGLDHIARVRAEALNVSKLDSDIVEELATLRLPAGVHLLVGSQPGEHLQVFHGTTVAMPEWTHAEVRLLASRFRLESVNRLENHDELLDALCVRSEGNPLYATVLLRGLASIAEDPASNLVGYLAESPSIRGDIANYYAHLYKAATTDVRIVAQVLAVTDFGVTESELQELTGPLVASQVPLALRRLRPCLIEVAGQGGWRIFHESYRRFISDKLHEDGASIATPLAIVAEWLKQQGLHESARSYRYLLPALRRVDPKAVTDLVQHDFVSTSVSWGHGRAAIERNLAVLSNSAADTSNWPAQARCAELFRAVATCFEEHLLTPRDYWTAFISVHGKNLALDRLLFEGVPTLERHLGMVVCSMLDDAGLVPPWKEYLNLPAQQLSEARADNDDDDPWVATVSAAALHGRICVEGFDSAASWLVAIAEEDPSSSELEALAARAHRSLPSPVLETLMAAGDIPRRLLIRLLLVRSTLLWAQGDISRASSIAKEALLLCEGSADAWRALMLGAPADMLPFAPPDLPGLPPEPRAERWLLTEWLDSASLLAHAKPAALSRATRKHSRENSWQSAWYAFALATAQAEQLSLAAAPAASTMAAQSLRALETRLRPHHPHPLDRYSIRRIARPTISRTLKLLTQETDQLSALDTLSRLVDLDEAHIQGEPCGAIQRDDLLELVQPLTATSAKVRERIKLLADAQVTKTEDTGEFFVVHAQIRFATIRLLVASGFREHAIEHWRHASQCVTGYGQRKDVALGQLIEALPALERDDRLEALEVLFPLAYAVVNHSDGKGTWRLPNACLEALAQTAPEAAAQVIAQLQVSSGGALGERIENAVDDLCEASEGLASPAIIALCSSTRRFHVHYDPRATEAVESRLKTIRDISSADSELTASLLRLLAARVEGDYDKSLDDCFGPIIDLADKRGVSLTRPNSNVGPERRPEDEGFPKSPDRGSVFVSADLPPVAATPVQLMSWLRHRPPAGARPVSRNEWVNRVGYFCAELSFKGQEAVATRILHFASREDVHGGWETAHWMSNLGEGFVKCGLAALAATAYTLAFAAARGGGGWHAVGGDEHAEWLVTAVRIDVEVARRVFSSEIVRRSGPGYVLGITSCIIQRVPLWSAKGVARDAFWAALRVLQHRLPSQVRRVHRHFIFRRSQLEDWSLDECLILLIAARVSHPELDRKRSALWALATSIKKWPDLVIRPLDGLLRMDGAPLSSFLLLDALWLAEPAPFVISTALNEVLILLAASPEFGTANSARKLLQRAALSAPTQMPVDVVLADSAEHHSIDTLRLLDWGNRLDRLSQLSPTLFDFVSRRFEHAFFHSPIGKEYGRYRHKYAARVTKSPGYSIPILSWENEMFEVTMHESANQVRRETWKAGRMTPTFDDSLVALLAPHTRLHIALHACRGVRPTLGLPSSQSSAVEEVPEVGLGDEFAGWRVLGRYEREYVFESELLHYDPTRTIHLSAGAAAPGFAEAAPELPFGNCSDPTAWFVDHRGGQTPTLEVGGLFGVIIGACFLESPLGRGLLLVPAPGLAARYGLTSSAWPGRLAWLNSDGTTAIALRTWSVRPIQSGGEEPGILVGCEVVASPMFYSKLVRDVAGRIVFCKSITEHE
jgi:hypothetical protein